jgi:hypothetical protein
MHELSNWGFVAFAFGLSWAVLLGYAAFVAGRLRRARRAFAEAVEAAAEVEP